MSRKYRFTAELIVEVPDGYDTVSTTGGSEPRHSRWQRIEDSPEGEV